VYCLLPACSFSLSVWQGENLEMYKDFKDLEVVVANASKCQVVDVESDTLITCYLPLVDEKLLNDDGDASVQVTVHAALLLI